MEPIILRRGKLIHKEVQAVWSGTIEGKTIRPEYNIQLHLNSDTSTGMRIGRIDLFVEKLEDFVSIFEIKSTDWDKIKETNRRRLLNSHARQMFRYVDKFLTVDRVNVCAAIIYSLTPKTDGLTHLIEIYFNSHGFQVLWFTEEESTNQIPLKKI